MPNWSKVFERDYTIQYWETCPYMLSAMNGDFVVLPIENDITIYKNIGATAVCFLSAEKKIEHEKAVLEKYRDPKNSKKFIEFFIKTGEKYVKTAKRASKQKSLVNAYETYWKQWVQYTSALYVTFELNELFADNLCEFVEKRYEEVKPPISLAHIFSNVLRPSKIAGTVQAGLDAVEVKQNYSQEKLEEFRKKYEWFPCLDLKYAPLSIQGAKEIVDTTQAIEKKHSPVDVAKLLKLSNEEWEFVDVARNYFYVKDLRDEFRRKGVFNVMPLYKKISQELEISYAQTYSLLKAEIIAGLQGEKVDTREATARLKQEFLLWRENGVKCLTGKKAVEKAAQIGIATTKIAAEPLLIKGIPASKGVVRGKVRLVKVAVHLHRVQKGEVLVALTTNPNYLTAMNLAAAIVTDEGGLTSHAAIVSRELKKPCIVGTKIATKVLNDGDFVEVNGNTGEVRKIE